MVRIPQNLNNPLNKGFQLKKNISPVENIFFPNWAHFSAQLKKLCLKCMRTSFSDKLVL